MSKNVLLKQAVRSALAVGAAGSMVGSGIALAQTAAPASSTAPTGTNLSQIVVTGSHIPQTSIATSQPVVTISRQQIDATGFTSLGQILQNLSQAGASFNSQDNFFIGPYSTGFEGINLKNLGSNRVLVLVNGHRWIPTLGGAVDLSSIPASIIQRIEVLLDGASAVYGSDAISGVVNVITVKNYSGAEAHAYYGAYDAHGIGGGWDGKTQRYSFTLGQSGNRGSVLLTAGYRQMNPIWAGNRNISKEPLIGFGRKLYTSYTGNGFFTLGNPSNSSVPASLSSCFYPSPSTLGRNDACSGPLYGSNANPHKFTDADRVNYAPGHYLATPSESWYGFAQGHYDLSDDVTYSGEFMFRERTSTQVISPTPMGLGAFGFWFANGLPIGISANNKYNPFNADLVPALSTQSPTYGAWCAKYGSNPNGGCTQNADLLYRFRMNPLALGYRTTEYDSATWYFRNGFNGYFQLAGNQWTWDVTYGFGRNRVNSTLGGIQNTVDLQNALGPNCTGGCVPLNFFGGQAGITPAMKNYVDTKLHNQAGVTQRDYEGDLAGNFFNSWYAGPWGAAAGYEYLEQDGFYSPSPVIASGNVTSNAFNPTNGRIATDAEYAELKVPLASNLPLAKSISVDLANRWSQFKVDGGTGSARAHASTGRLAFKWQPIRSLLLRGTWSQSFREPSISELFSGQSTSYNNVNDPCINPSGNPPYPGCPNPSPTASYGQIPTVYGGNADLTPERATSRQVGFVWSPRFLPGFDFSADYYKVEITNAVGTIPENVILNSCYIQGLSQYCSLIQRTGPFITNVKDTNLNTGSVKTNGWDLGLRYRFPTTPVGQFTVSYSANFVKDFVSCNVLTSTQSSCTDYAGNGATSVFTTIPKQRMNASLNWNYGPWAATWSMELIGRMYEPCNSSTAVIFSPPYGWCSKYSHTDSKGHVYGVNELGTTIYNDAQVSYTVSSWNTTFTLGVNNIFQKNPPISMNAFNDNYLWYYYRIPGRFVYGRVSVNF